jgi:hypothetical protein
MSETVEYEGEVYRVVRRELPEGDSLLDIPPPTAPGDDCGHAVTRRCYILLGCYDKSRHEYDPGGLVESKCGRVLVCVRCWSVKGLAGCSDEWLPDLVKESGR